MLDVVLNASNSLSPQLICMFVNRILMKGKKHERRIKAKEEVRMNGGKADCHLCFYVATSAVSLEFHMQGKEHKSRVERAKNGFPGRLNSTKSETDPDTG